MRKQRTREHIIEDLGFNHVERQVLHAGYTLSKNGHDYGYDGTIHTFNDRGETENYMILFQLKSTDHIQYSSKKKVFTFDLSQPDLEHWLRNRDLVLFILYDAQKDVAYFVDLQAYFNENRILLENVRKFVRIYIPKKAVFDTAVTQELRELIKY